MLNTAELRAELDLRLGPEQRKEWWTESARHEDLMMRQHYKALKKFRRSTLLTTPAQTRPTVLDGITPDAEWSWVVRQIGVYLASAGTGQAFITSDSAATLGARTQSQPVASFTTSAQYQTIFINSGACILDVDEGLYLNFTSNINGYMLAGWMSPTEMVGRLA